MMSRQQVGRRSCCHRLKSLWLCRCLGSPLCGVVSKGAGEGSTGERTLVCNAFDETAPCQIGPMVYIKHCTYN